LQRSVGLHGLFLLVLFSQSLHVQVRAGAPTRSRHMPQPCGDQHHRRLAVREVAHHARPPADLPQDPLPHVVRADLRPVLPRKRPVGKRLLDPLPRDRRRLSRPPNVAPKIPLLPRGACKRKWFARLPGAILCRDGRDRELCRVQQRMAGRFCNRMASSGCRSGGPDPRHPFYEFRHVVKKDINDGDHHHGEYRPHR